MRLLVGFDGSDEGRDALELTVLPNDPLPKLIGVAPCPLLVVPRP